jgi:hypothetical protein
VVIPLEYGLSTAFWLVVFTLMFVGCGSPAEEPPLRTTHQPGLTPSASQTWLPYLNTVYEYEIHFPGDWPVEIRNPQPGDTIEMHRFEVRQGPDRRSDRVSVSIFFQGGHCEGRPDRIERSPIVVSGIPGEEIFCDHGSSLEIVWRFENAKGGRTYTIIARSVTDHATVRKIVESFKFLP